MNIKTQTTVIFFIIISLVFSACRASSLSSDSSPSPEIINNVEISEQTDVNTTSLSKSSVPHEEHSNTYKDIFVFDPASKENILYVPNELMILLNSDSIDFEHETIRLPLEYDQYLKYPSFKNVLNNKNLTNFVNQSILDRIGNIDDLSSYYRLDYVITKSNKNILSIFFYGDLNLPRKMQFYLTIDLNKIELFDMNQYFLPDEDTYNVIMNPENVALIQDYTTLEPDIQGVALINYMEEFKNNDITTLNTAFFGEENRLFVLIGIRHVQGDYILLSVPLESE